jgi:protease PrsW
VPVRVVAFGFNHAMFTSLTGIGLGLARYEQVPGRRILFIVAGLAASMTAHFLHNFFVSLGITCVLSFLADWMGVLVVGIIVVLAWQREKGWMVSELAEEVITGVLTPLEYETIVSRRERLRRGWQVLGASGLRRLRLWRRLADTATELAFKKHQQSIMGEERGNGHAIAALRARIAEIRTSLAEESDA